MTNTAPANPAAAAGIEFADVERSTAIAGRSCGECTLCCKLLSIAELNKPEARWCVHCKPGRGCTIYEQRPFVCRDFVCTWLGNPQIEDMWYPRRSKMVLHLVVNQLGTPPRLLKVLVDEASPTVWRREPYYSKGRSSIKQMALFGLRSNTFHVYIIVCGTQTTNFLILPHRDIQNPGPGVVKRVGESSWDFLPCDSDETAAEIVRADQRRTSP